MALGGKHAYKPKDTRIISLSFLQSPEKTIRGALEGLQNVLLFLARYSRDYNGMVKATKPSASFTTMV